MRIGLSEAGTRRWGGLAILLVALPLLSFLGIAMSWPGVAHAEETTTDTAGLKDHMREEDSEERKSKVKVTTNQQTYDREVDFLSVCCESGDLDIEMTIAYANGEPSKAHEADYLYVRLDVDGEDGFKWLSPVVDGDTLTYEYHLTGGKRAAFWIFDYPLDNQDETAPTLLVKATDRRGRQVYGTAVGAFRSLLEDRGGGTFFLSNARVDTDAEDKAGLPNAKILLSVLDDDENQEPNPSDAENDDGDNYYGEDGGSDDGDDTGVEIEWGDGKKGREGKVPQLGDPNVLISIVAMALSLIALVMVNRRKK